MEQTILTLLMEENRQLKDGTEDKIMHKKYRDSRVLIKGPKEVKAEALVGEWKRYTKEYKYIHLETIFNFSRATATCMFP